MLDPIEADDDAAPFSQRLSLGGRKSMGAYEDELDPFRSSQHFEGAPRRMPATSRWRRVMGS